MATVGPSTVPDPIPRSTTIAHTAVADLVRAARLALSARDDNGWRRALTAERQVVTKNGSAACCWTRPDGLLWSAAGTEAKRVREELLVAFQALCGLAETVGGEPAYLRDSGVANRGIWRRVYQSRDVVAPDSVSGGNRPRPSGTIGRDAPGPTRSRNSSRSNRGCGKGRGKTTPELACRIRPVYGRRPKPSDSGPRHSNAERIAGCKALYRSSGK